jgi:hypothetical protein
MNRYLIYDFTKVTWLGIIGSWGALKGLGQADWYISEESDIQLWWLRN